MVKEFYKRDVFEDFTWRFHFFFGTAGVNKDKLRAFCGRCNTQLLEDHDWQRPNLWCAKCEERTFVQIGLRTRACLEFQRRFRITDTSDDDCWIHAYERIEALKKEKLGSEAGPGQPRMGSRTGESSFEE